MILLQYEYVVVFWAGRGIRKCMKTQKHRQTSDSGADGPSMESLIQLMASK